MGKAKAEALDSRRAPLAGTMINANFYKRETSRTSNLTK